MAVGVIDRLGRDIERPHLAIQRSSSSNTPCARASAKPYVYAMLAGGRRVRRDCHNNRAGDRKRQRGGPDDGEWVQLHSDPVSSRRCRRA
jgi:hypothetical protein